MQKSRSNSRGNQCLSFHFMLKIPLLSKSEFLSLLESSAVSKRPDLSRTLSKQNPEDSFVLQHGLYIKHSENKGSIFHLFSHVCRKGEATADPSVYLHEAGEYHV